jgi:radical SAM-linked protein
VRFTKLGKVRFTSHRDVARLWERALRKAGVPVAYTGGFAPRPRLHFGLALPTGYESHAEYLDVDLTSGLAGLPGFSGLSGLGPDVTAGSDV